MSNTAGMLWRRASRRRGVTLIELLLAMVVGLIVLGTVTSYVGTTDRNITANAMREDYARKARFLGIALRRDIADAGVGIESLPGWGTVAVFNDTLTVLSVPFEPNPDPAYALAPVASATVHTSHASNCGATCMRLRRTASGVPLTLQSGMVARLQSGATRRLILINNVATPGANDSVAVTFRNTATLLWRRSVTNATTATAAVTGMTKTNTTVQRLNLVAYWRDASNNLWRATRMNPANGQLVGEIVATGCTQFQVRLMFEDGTIAASADSTVAGRRFNQINAIRISATFQSDNVDARINGGQPLARAYVFHVQPRNLIYERNRDN